MKDTNKTISYKLSKTSYHKIIAMVFTILFLLLLLIALIVFVSIIVGMNKYGGEMADGFGLIMTLPFLLHLIIFSTWSYRIFQLKAPKQNTTFQLGLIFLLGLILPCVFLIRFDTIICFLF